MCSGCELLVRSEFNWFCCPMKCGVPLIPLVVCGRSREIETLIMQSMMEPGDWRCCIWMLTRFTSIWSEALQAGSIRLKRCWAFWTAWCYVIPTSLLRIPYSFLDAFLWTAIVYYSVGLAPAPGRCHPASPGLLLGLNLSGLLGILYPLYLLLWFWWYTCTVTWVWWQAIYTSSSFSDYWSHGLEGWGLFSCIRVAFLSCALQTECFLYVCFVFCYKWWPWRYTCVKEKRGAL